MGRDSLSTLPVEAIEQKILSVCLEQRPECRGSFLHWSTQIVWALRDGQSALALRFSKNLQRTEDGEVLHILVQIIRFGCFQTSWMVQKPCIIDDVPKSFPANFSLADPSVSIDV